jgi:ankyrin repeat protein
MSGPDSASVHAAVMRHNLPEVTQALARGEAVDALDEEGRTPLFYAVKDGDSAIVDELIRRGANPKAQDKCLETPLHFAAREYQFEVAHRLIEGGANPNGKTTTGTRLYGALYLNRVGEAT